MKVTFFRHVTWRNFGKKERERKLDLFSSRSVEKFLGKKRERKLDLFSVT